jgi:hypothetical protein
VRIVSGRRESRSIMNAMPTIKERIENNIVVVVLGTAVAAFSAGWGAHVAIGGNGTVSNQGSSQGTDWQATATQKGWIDKNVCPALPVTLRILSPGDNATIEYGSGDLYSDLIINASQPLPSAGAVGYIANVEGDTNFYVMFPTFYPNEQRTTFRDSNFIRFPKKITKPSHVDMWALLIDDERNLGSVYGSLDEIKAVSNTIFLSQKIGIAVVPRD